MPSDWPHTPSRRCPRPAGLPHSVSPDLPLKPCPGGGERVERNIFVDVDGLRVLPQVVEPREAP